MLDLAGSSREYSLRFVFRVRPVIVVASPG